MEALIVCVFLILLGSAQTYLIHDCNMTKLFVDGHNRRRLLLAQGALHGQPAATKMKYMTWDEELENKASKWASRQKYAHNPDKTIASGRFRTGENIASFSTTDLKYSNVARLPEEWAMKPWWDEYSLYTFGDVPNKQTGHYTQMAWANSDKLGCAMSNYHEKDVHGTTWNTFFIVCNYGPPGNVIKMDYKGNVIDALPYVAGRASHHLVSEDKEAKPYGIRCTKTASTNISNTKRTSTNNLLSNKSPSTNVPNSITEKPASDGTQSVFTHTISLILIAIAVIFL